MKRILLVVLCLLFFNATFAQKFVGQWSGYFQDNSAGYLNWGGSKCEYVLEIETNGKTVSGYSYTYFMENGKKYYTICKLKGKQNETSNTIEVIEYERTKTNVPNEINNCFQIHKLRFVKAGTTLRLEGTWAPAPNQGGDCGYGTTLLTKKVLTEHSAFSKNTSKNTFTPKTKMAAATTTKNKAANTTSRAPIASNKTGLQPNKPKTPTANTSPVIAEVNKANNAAIPSNTITTTQIKKLVPSANLLTRAKEVTQTIKLNKNTFFIDLYDNGEIDGDTVTVIYNGKVIASKRRLTDKALTFELQMEDLTTDNELIMYAENLGSIPPNTAVMVVRTDNSRHEVRLSSDFKKSASVLFKRKND
jgi:hypothetical protein